MCTNEMLLIPYGYKKQEFLEGVLVQKNILLPATPKNIRNCDNFHIEYNKIPCGYCEECLLKRSQEWSVRLIKESAYHLNNWFVTLTYDDDNLPDHNSLDKEELKTFFHSLKNSFIKEGKKSPIYYSCGEYGDTSFRPHYHAIIFDLDLDDIEQLYVDGVPYLSGTGEITYHSDKLSKIWHKGFVTLNKVTTESCRYVAGYVQKKVYKKDIVELKSVSFSKDEKGDPIVFDSIVRKSFYDTLGIVAPFSLMSKGIGKSYFVDNKNKIYLTDEVIFTTSKGVKTRRPPRYYDKLYSKEDDPFIRERKETRKQLAISKGKVDTRSDSEKIEYNFQRRLKNQRNDRIYKRGEI